MQQHVWFSHHAVRNVVPDLIMWILYAVTSTRIWFLVCFSVTFSLVPKVPYSVHWTFNIFSFSSWVHLLKTTDGLKCNLFCGVKINVTVPECYQNTFSEAEVILFKNVWYHQQGSSRSETEPGKTFKSQLSKKPWVYFYYVVLFREQATVSVSASSSCGAC